MTQPSEVQQHFLTKYGLSLEIFSGWEPLVYELDQTLSKIDPYYRPGQIKTKFGGLRYYVDYSPSRPDGFEQAIRIAEALAETTCELCGETQGVTTEAHRYWVWTLCPRHHEEKRNR